MTQRLEEPEWVLPFEHMRVGESFFIPTLRPADMTYVIDTRAKVAEVRVKSYPAIKDGCLGLRVWRVR
jgi:hypothetical protein